MDTRQINHKFYKQIILLMGLFVCSCSIWAQSPLPLNEDSLPSKRFFILHANIGYTPNASEHGESAWQEAQNKNSCGISYTCRLMTYSPKKIIGYGLYSYNYIHNKHHDFEVYANEKTRINYIAPQISYIKRATAFPNCFGLIDFGIGYVHYISDTRFEENRSFKVNRSGIGMNLDIGYEYAFAKHWGAKIEIGTIYTPIKFHSDQKPPYSSIQLRNKMNLFLVYMQLGISHYL